MLLSLIITLISFNAYGNEPGDHRDSPTAGSADMSIVDMSIDDGLDEIPCSRSLSLSISQPSLGQTIRDSLEATHYGHIGQLESPLPTPYGAIPKDWHLRPPSSSQKPMPIVPPKIAPGDSHYGPIPKFKPLSDFLPAIPSSRSVSCGDNPVCKAAEFSESTVGSLGCWRLNDRASERVCQAFEAAKENHCDYVSGKDFTWAVCNAVTAAKTNTCDSLKNPISKTACSCMSQPWNIDFVSGNFTQETAQFCSNYQNYYLEKTAQNLADNPSSDQSWKQYASSVQLAEKTYKAGFASLTQEKLSYKYHTCNGRTLLQCLERLEVRCQNPTGKDKQQTKDNKALCSLIQDSKDTRKELKALFTSLKPKKNQTVAEGDWFKSQLLRFGQGQDLDAQGVYTSKLETIKKLFKAIEENPSGASILKLYRTRVHGGESIQTLLGLPAQHLETRKILASKHPNSGTARALTGRILTFQSAVQRSSEMYKLASAILDAKTEKTKTFNPIRKKLLAKKIQEAEERLSEMKKKNANHPWFFIHRYIPAKR